MEVDQELELALFDWIDRLLRLAMSEISTFARQKGISNNQLDLLLTVYYCQTCDMSALCNHMQISRPAGSQAVKRLHQLGLVEVLPSADDQRVKLVLLSPEGQALVDEYNEDRRNTMRALAARIPAEAHQDALETLGYLNQALADFARVMSGLGSD